MVAAMAAFAVEDVLIKLAAERLPTGQILLVLGLGGTLAFAALARRAGRPVIGPALRHPAVMARNAGEVIGTAGFVTALALVPLSTLTAIFQAMPLAVTLGAALFLGERVGWRRWSAILVGFAGVLLILRPGTEGFRPEALWALLAVAGLALRDLATRRVPPRVSTLELAVWGFAAVGLLGAGQLALSGGAVLPDAREAALLAAALAVGLVAYAALTAATRAGTVADIAPFRYSRLLFGLALGALVFGERPDAATLAGAALILASGLYTLARERARLSALSNPPAAR
jgi:drug/metabolite transporter (DMT)-like permease